jgi:hypothetical protein
MNKTRQSCVTISTVVWVIGLVLSISISDLAVPPIDAGLYLGLAGIAIVPLGFGSRKYRVFGMVALVISLSLTCLDYDAGLRIKAMREHNRQAVAKQQSVTTSPAAEIQTNLKL